MNQLLLFPLILPQRGMHVLQCLCLSLRVVSSTHLFMCMCGVTVVTDPPTYRHTTRGDTAVYEAFHTHNGQIPPKPTIRSLSSSLLSYCLLCPLLVSAARLLLICLLSGPLHTDKTLPLCDGWPWPLRLLSPSPVCCCEYEPTSASLCLPPSPFLFPVDQWNTADGPCVPC